jgi:hypothetical protein
MDNNNVSDEQELVESVLQGNTSSASRPAGPSPAGSDFVKDIEAIKNGLASIDDEEPPMGPDEVLVKKDLRHRRRSPQWIEDAPVDWYHSPFVLSFGFVVAIWFLYIFISFLMR